MRRKASRRGGRPIDFLKCRVVTFFVEVGSGSLISEGRWHVDKATEPPTKMARSNSPLAYAVSKAHRVRSCLLNGITRSIAPVESTNPNLAGPETGPVRRVRDRRLLTQENGLDTRRFKALPAVPEWSDFDDCHGKVLGFLTNLCPPRIKGSSRPSQPSAKMSSSKFAGEPQRRTDAVRIAWRRTASGKPLR